MRMRWSLDGGQFVRCGVRKPGKLGEGQRVDFPVHREADGVGRHTGKLDARSGLNRPMIFQNRRRSAVAYQVKQLLGAFTELGLIDD
jgi:hypothetical protein